MMQWLNKQYQKWGEKPDHGYIFPLDARPEYKWGWQGLLARYRYRQLLRLTDDVNEDTPEFITADENYDRARFACIYGQTGNYHLRELTKYIEENDLAQRYELRTAVRYKDLKSNTDGLPVTKPSKLCAILGTIQILLGILAGIYLVTLLSLSPLDLYLKATGVLLVLGIYGVFVFTYFKTTIKPYFIAKRLEPIVRMGIVLPKGRGPSLQIVR